jgi:hypothetical protein
MLVLVALMGCGSEPCSDRSGDSDCDGVPDADDLCPATDPLALTDRVGCSGAQAAGCEVALSFPEDGARDAERFGWSGTCDVYVVQVSEYEDFPAGTVRTLWRGPGQEIALDFDEPWWRVVGGMDGYASEAATPPRELR